MKNVSSWRKNRIKPNSEREYTVNKMVDLNCPLREEFMFFESGRDRLYGSIHQPEQNRGNRKIGFVLCQPFVIEQFKVYRILFNFSRFLAARGFTVLRFDYMGTGDSSGKFEDADVETRVSNVIDAVMFLKNRTDISHIGLIGCRLGAVWAAMAAEKIGPDIFQLILWDPVLDVNKYLYNQLRGNLSEQTVMYRKVVENRDKLVERIYAGEKVNVSGYGIAKEFYSNATMINILANPPKLNTKIKMLRTSTAEIKEKSEVVRFLKNYYENASPGDIIRLPREFSWEVIKGYNVWPEKSFKKIFEALTNEVM